MRAQLSVRGAGREVGVGAVLDTERPLCLQILLAKHRERRGGGKPQGATTVKDVQQGWSGYDNKPWKQEGNLPDQILAVATERNRALLPVKIIYEPFNANAGRRGNDNPPWRDHCRF